uniref:Uncharacterized protein n=1 Tax=Anguilla anguilla TaxID=7936 RepID=A0A0E9QCQ4_ANGAN
MPEWQDVVGQSSPCIFGVEDLWDVLCFVLHLP